MTTLESGVLILFSTSLRQSSRIWRTVPAVRTTSLNGLDELLPFDHLAEDGVLAVEMGCWDGGDEELRAVGVGT